MSPPGRWPARSPGPAVRGVVLAVLAALVSAAPARALTHTVTNLSDAATGSLRQRIQIAAAGDTIEFGATAVGTLDLFSELTIGRDLVIRGPGARLTRIDGLFNSRVFNVTAGTVVISDLTIQAGRVQGANGGPGQAGQPARGGAIHNAATLTLERVYVQSSQARGGNGTQSHALGAQGGAGEGGGIYNTGSLTLSSCTMSGNQATGGAGVGTVGRGDGGLGRGGAIHNAGTLTIVNSTFDNNSANGGGASGTVGGDGRGGAISNAGSLAIEHGTIVANTASGGIGNSSDGDGEGGGLYGAVAVKSSIVALNAVVRGVATGPDAFGAFPSQGHNLIGKSNGSSGWLASDQTGTIAAPLDPNLGPTSYESGGQSPSRRPLPGSAALDRGGPAGPALDQTGRSRVHDDPALPNAAGGAGADIGAVEVHPPMTWWVTTAGDARDGSLRRAVDAAIDGDSIRFSPAVAGPILVTHGSLLMYEAVVLAGPGANALVVQRAGGPTVFYVSAPVTIAGLTVTGATGPSPSAGAVYVHTVGALTLESCAIVDNTVTGLHALGSVVARGCTFSGNASSTGAGAIYAGGALTLHDCTITLNTGHRAGGVWTSGNAARSIVHGSIVENTYGGTATGAGGLYHDAATAPAVSGSVVALNTRASPGSPSDLGGSFTSQGFNFIGASTGGLGFTHGTNGDQVGSSANPIDPLIGPLGDHGGTTRTRVPLAGSPLIDQSRAFGLALDQRGAPRPFDTGIPDAAGGDGSDVGAAEWLPGPMAVDLTPPATRASFAHVAPLPFRAALDLTIVLPAAGEAEVSIFSVDGRRVRTVARGPFAPGAHRLTWDGRDDSGREAPSGVYFARLLTGEGAATRRIVRVR